MRQEDAQIGRNPSNTGAKSKLYYGWVVAIAGAVAVMAVSNFQYTFGVFVQPIIDKFGWSRAAISGCVSVRSIASGIASPVVGALSDKYGFVSFQGIPYRPQEVTVISEKHGEQSTKEPVPFYCGAGTFEILVSENCLIIENNRRKKDWAWDLQLREGYKPKGGLN